MRLDLPVEQCSIKDRSVDWLWWLIAFYFLANLVKNIWINRYLKSGWVIPFVGICLWLVALWSFLNAVVPLWSFALMAIFCEPIGGLIGSILLMLRFGGRGRFAAWRLYELTEQQFFRFNAACRRSRNQAAAQKNLEARVSFPTYCSLRFLILQSVL